MPQEAQASVVYVAITGLLMDTVYILCNSLFHKMYTILVKITEFVAVT